MCVRGSRVRCICGEKVAWCVDGRDEVGYVVDVCAEVGCGVYV